MDEKKYFPTAANSLPENLKVQNAMYLAEFSNANIKSSRLNLIQFQSYKSSALNFVCRPKRLLVASDQKLEYVGSNYENEASEITSSMLKVAVFKKHTREMKFYDVDLFHLKPLLKCHLDKKAMEKSWFEQSQDLALEFGSKTKKNAITSRLKYQSTETDSIDSSLLNRQALLVEKANVINAEKESEIFPRQNKNAISVNEVYDIHDIISEENYCALDSGANIFINATFDDIRLWKTDEKFCSFVIRYLEARFQSLSLHYAKLLCYFQYMIFFMRKNYKDWKKKDPVPEVPQPFKKILMNRYLLNSKSMPQRMKDKLLADAMVLALTINNYVIDGNILAGSTHISLKKLVLVAYALGCHVSERKSENTKLIILKLPLYKYEPRTTFKRK